MNDPRGSIWRKWDLHIHTPASFHWDGGKRFSQMTAGEKESCLQQILECIEDSEVGVFGIMDYWTFEGYLEIIQYLSQPGVQCAKTILPGMELRIEAPVDYRLNIQVILSDSLTKQQLQDFKGALRIGTIDRNPSDEALIAFAKSLDESKAKVHGFSKAALTDDQQLLRLGSMTAKITRESLRDALNQIPERTCLIVMPYDTSDGLSKLDWQAHPYDDCYFMRSAHIFETREEDNVDLFLNRRTEKNEHFIENFLKTMGGRAKPVISGSDAHKISNYGVYPSGRISWLKADPTFEGLLQVFNEPERSFIGEIPPKLVLVQTNKTKYIQSVDIRRKPEATLTEVWFDNAIPLNPDLVAIIGNKGNGKSALADTIGLLGNTKQHEDFTFLSTRSFRDSKNNKAKYFAARMTWESGAAAEKDLDEPVNIRQPETCKYIPQNFLEKICNEIGGIDETDFDRELKKVIFSHVEAADRLRMATLDDLISYKTEEANARMEMLRQELRRINEGIVELERQAQPDHRESLEFRLELKEQELASHDHSKPAEITKPETDSAKQEEISKVAAKIDETQAELADYEKQLTSATEEQIKQASLIAVVDKLLARLNNVERQLQVFKTESQADFDEIDISMDLVLKVEVDMQPLNERRQAFVTLRTKASEELDAANTESAAARKQLAEKQIEELRLRLDEPNKKYQAYVASLKAWQDKRIEILGDEITVDSLAYYQKQLKELEGVPQALTQAKTHRLIKAKEIYVETEKLADTYRQLYAPVQQFIEFHPLAEDKFQLNFDVGIIDTGFQERFFSVVSHGVAGTFCGVDEGQEMLTGILSRQDFGSPDGVEAFLSEIVDCIENDRRPAGGPVRVADQIRKSYEVTHLYDLIFSLEYLTPRYSLRMGDKELEQLSPGERGTLLLVFYLLVDKDDTPLVIDQPEENLDNQTVYELLVPCIKQAKQRRQIVIVTHNPNLAVVCDAEQIIRATLDKKDNYRMKYESGAIENPVINRAIVDVLEGTMPAFDNRDSKYLPEPT